MADASLQADCQRDELGAILEEVIACERIDQRALDRILRRHPRGGGGLYSKREILSAFRERGGGEGLASFDPALAEVLRTCPTRSVSGVTPVAALTKPFPCPGRCIFCPSQAGMPRSYLAAEPGCQRAAANRFDPYLQTWNRLLAFRRMGHPTAKIELILLGGTWSFYPEAYQVWFVRRCLEALNDFGAGRDGREEAGAESAFASPPLFLPPDWDALESAQRENETSGSRCVGLALETRPDHVDDEEALRIRRLGGTKVQIGLQSLSDEVLRRNRRGHDVAASRRALRLLRGAGFKLHVHWMPNLYGSSPAADLEDFDRLFSDPDFRPDEIKVYPCSLVHGVELERHYRSGAWRPYTHEELLLVLCGCLRRIPEYCRLTRMVRDIPSHEILAGNKLSNLRELATARLAEQGLASRDIRAREIRDRSCDPERLSLRSTGYDTSLGREEFLELVTPEDRLAAFLRLSLPASGGSAMIREVHVYGVAADLGERSPKKAQHLGLGRRLVERAARIAREAGYRDLAVISAVGTRDYYRAQGFRDRGLYQHRSLVERSAELARNA
jgi:elongator complex protein 3